MKIAFFDIHDWEIDKLKKSFSNSTLKFYKEPFAKKHLSQVKDFDVISVFIYSKLNKEIIESLGKVKLIATRSMGFDHIDIGACKRRGIKVCNTPHYGDSAVAEHAFALMLSLSRNIQEAYQRTKKGNYSIEGLEGFDLKGKTLGVIGTGRIGATVVKIASGFGMNIVAYDVIHNEQLLKEIKFSYVSLDHLLKISDIITLHVPYMPQTHHLLNKNNMKTIKRGALLINTSRGPVIDTTALLSALDKGVISKAGLDVLEGEDLLRDKSIKLDKEKKKQLQIDKKLLHHKNVFFTPHIAFFTREATESITDITIDNIKSFEKGKPINILN